MSAFTFANPNLLPPDADRVRFEKEQQAQAFAAWQQAESDKAARRAAIFNNPPVFGGRQDPSLAPTPFLTAEQMRGAAAAQPVAVASDALTGEQMRHSLSQLQGPPAPPLAGVASTAALTPHEAAYARQLATGEVRRGTAVEKLATAGLLKDMADRTTGQKGEAAGDAQKIEAERQQANDQNAIDQGAVAKAAAQEDAMRGIAMRGQMAAEAQMKRVQSAADYAAQQSIHNFWADKSSGARILGILSQAFAGAANGLAGNPSAPTPLDRVIQRDMERQMANLQQANRNVENQRGVLRDLYEKTGNTLSATAAMYNAAWKRIELQGAQLKTKYANPTADAAFSKLQGLVQQRIADSQDKVFNQLREAGIQQFQHGVNALNETDRTDAMLGASGATASEKPRFHLAGTQGNVDSQTYGMFKDTHEGYTTVMAQLNEIGQIAHEYHAGKITEAEAITRYNTARGDLLAAQRKVQGTGAALSDQEFTNLQSQLPQASKSIVPFLSKSLALDLPTQVQQIKDSVSRRYFSHVGGTIQGVQLDPNDPIYGPQVQRYMQAIAAQQQARG